MTTAAFTHDRLWGRSSAPRGMIVHSVRSGRFAPSSRASRAWGDTATQSAPSFAVIEARKSLANLTLPVSTTRSVETFLETVCTPQSTVPSITHGDDDDTALLHWVAGPMSVEVEVGPHGATYFWGVDEHGAKQSVEGPRSQVESLARRLVGTMAARVGRSNPEWRQQYLQR